MTKPPLRPYQADGVAWLRGRARGLLADEMGLGKSRQLIEGAQGRTLVIAPAMVLDSGTWDQEIAKWASDPLLWSTASYTRLTRTETRTIKKRDGTEQQKKVITLRPEVAGEWDTVILDEAHYIKNGNSQRTASVRKIAANAKRLYLATGTPIPNWPEELFVPLQFLFPEDSKPGGRLGSKWRWIEEWFTQKPDPFNPRSTIIGKLIGCSIRCEERDVTDPCEHYQRFADANFQGSMLLRLRDDVLTDLPPLTRQRIEIAMTPTQWRVYQEMKKKQLAELDSGERIIAWSTGSKATMLDKLTTGLGVMQENAIDHADSSKLARLREDLSNRSRPTLVVAHYRASVEACWRVAREMGLAAEMIRGGTSPADRRRLVADFQAGKLEVLVGSIETIAEGVTLTAADMIIMVETSWKPSRNQQAERRIHRLGQDRPCTVLDYVAVGPKRQATVDGNKRILLEGKSDAQTRTLTAARFAELL